MTKRLEVRKMGREILAFSSLKKQEIRALIYCAEALLTNMSEAKFLINGKPANDEQRDNFKKMLIHLDSARKKLTKMMVENQSSNNN